jgi:hypothetical protein
MTEMRDIHIHLTAQPGTTVHVTVADGNVTVVGDEARPGTRIQKATTPSDDALEAAIQRLDSSGASPNVRATVDGLSALGYDLKPAKTNVPGKLPENYLRIMDPRYTALATSRRPISRSVGCPTENVLLTCQVPSCSPPPLSSPTSRARSQA